MVGRKAKLLTPKRQHITSLILKDIHINTGHSGRNQILSKLRSKFWVAAANAVIRKLISKCTVCRRLHAKVSERKMADLPRDRLLPDNPPFTHTGVDYFGPFLIKRGRSLIKRYGVLFTYLTVRAVHIEVANSLDTSSCINAIRRLICRRGQVSTIRSDNGTNFIGAVRPGSIDPMKAVVQRVKGFAYYSLSFSRHNKNIKMEHFFLYILSRYFI